MYNVRNRPVQLQLATVFLSGLLVAAFSKSLFIADIIRKAVPESIKQRFKIRSKRGFPSA